LDVVFGLTSGLVVDDGDLAIGLGEAEIDLALQDEVFDGEDKVEFTFDPGGRFKAFSGGGIEKDLSELAGFSGVLIRLEAGKDLMDGSAGGLGFARFFADIGQAIQEEAAGAGMKSCDVGWR